MPCPLVVPVLGACSVPPVIPGVEDPSLGEDSVIVGVLPMPLPSVARVTTAA